MRACVHACVRVCIIYHIMQSINNIKKIIKIKNNNYTFIKNTDISS